MTPSQPHARSVPVAHFEVMFSGRPDPFDLSNRWYERRKRSMTLAALQREEYQTGLELGCAEGALTVLLASRVKKLIAVDGSATAVERAILALKDAPNVSAEVAALPREFPPGQYDLIVFSELGYFLDESDLTDLIGRARAALAPRGEFLAVHWRHPSTDYPSDGDSVHEALSLLMREHNHLVEHEEADFRLDSWSLR